MLPNVQIKIFIKTTSTAFNLTRVHSVVFTNDVHYSYRSVVEIAKLLGMLVAVVMEPMTLCCVNVSNTPST